MVSGEEHKKRLPGSGSLARGDAYNRYGQKNRGTRNREKVKHFYFAYGSNMNPARMRERKVAFHSRQRAVLPGYRLEFNKISRYFPGAGAANVVPARDSLVEGILYEIHAHGLARLDHFEGYPQHYDRVEVKLSVEDADRHAAIAYVAQSRVIGEGLFPSQEYLDHLLAGRDLLSAAYVERLAAWQTLETYVSKSASTNRGGR